MELCLGMVKRNIAMLTILAMLSYVPGIVMADTTTVSGTVTGGSLTIDAAASTTLSGVTLSVSSSQASTGSTAITTEDARGTGAGWTQSATMQNLSYTDAVQAASGNTSPSITLDATTPSRYDGTLGENSDGNPCYYTITINTGGALGTATYTVTNSDGTNCNDTGVQSAVTTGTGVDKAVGGKGVLVDMAAGTYVSGNTWTIGLGVVRYTSCTITPQAAVGNNSASTTGVTAQSAGAFSGSGVTSSSYTTHIATDHSGMANYTASVNWSCNWPPMGYAGAHTATFTTSVA